MEMGLWVVVAVVVFVLGNVMALKPKASEVRLGQLRLLARQLSLHPKLIPTPDWLQSTPTPAMISCYTYLDDSWRLPQAWLIATDGTWQQLMSGQKTPTDNTTHNAWQTAHPLSGQTITSPLAPYIKGLSFKANSVSIFWQDDVYVRTFSVKDRHALHTIEQELHQLRSYLIALAHS